MFYRKARELVEFYLPHLVTAGNYALAIQKDVVVHKNKGEGYSKLGQFLTDADLAVENFLEVVTLASGMNIDFEGEEAENSLNRKYFQKKMNPKFKVWVDPINGTFLYKDGSGNFDIIITITNNQTREIVAVIDYLPAYGVFYVGIKKIGAFFFTKNNLWTINGRPNYKMHCHKDPIGIYQIEEPFAERIETLGKCFDMENDLVPMWKILSKEISAYVKPRGYLLDSGAIAFIVEQAGGVVTDFSGKPIPNYLDSPKYRIPSLLVSSSKEIHQRILEQLKGHPLA